MKIVLEPDGDEFIVWAMLDDGRDVPPEHRSESFVIGTGTTKAQAIDSAIADLKRAWEQAEAWRG